MYNTIKYEVEQSILTITLNRPEQMNAFTVKMANELIEAFETASADDAVRAIVVTGAGKAFCAGMDLNQSEHGFDSSNVFGLNEDLQPTMDDMHNRLDDPEIKHGVRDTGGRVNLAIYDCTKPIIAAINGAAVGIGATMTCAMDIRFASERARVGFVFNKIGITPEACSSWFLPKIVGISRALEWTYTGDILSGDELLNANFVKAVVPEEELLDQAYALARKIAKHSPVSIALTRQMMYRNSAEDHPLAAHKVDSLAIFYASQVDGKEGIDAFLNKREANFTQKVSTDMPDFYPWW
ncbi:MAG: crotonase/enoyl-CoA hydratase family protein [Gammaproteobacteria bacterium]|nr:crotonase/enoyl-CoA hydratase family protein [Gammaproteobacteria bacterium]